MSKRHQIAQTGAFPYLDASLKRAFESSPPTNLPAELTGLLCALRSQDRQNQRLC